MWEGVPREIAKLCTQTNEDDMVRRGDPWGSDSGTTRAVDPFPTLQSVLEWAAVMVCGVAIPTVCEIPGIYGTLLHPRRV